MISKLKIVSDPTPLVFAPRLSKLLNIELYIKRDDLAGPSFGGNKSRQLEYYFGDALAQNADTILITGAVQSNFARLAASVACSQSMRAIVQLEDRVPGKTEEYRGSGNVLLSKLLGAEILTYPEGEDEAGADAALHDKARALREQGRNPYIIHLSEGHPPLGALGYVDAAQEIRDQKEDFDVVVVASGSGSTHAGLLAGFQSAASKTRIIGSCVRRDASQQAARIRRIMNRLADIYPLARPIGDDDINIWDGALAPGYGRVGAEAAAAMKMVAAQEGLVLDPVYTAKSFAAIPALAGTAQIPHGSKVCFVHTGGLAALFAYGQDLGKWI